MKPRHMRCKLLGHTFQVSYRDRRVCSRYHRRSYLDFPTTMRRLRNGWYSDYSNWKKHRVRWKGAA